MAVLISPTSKINFDGKVGDCGSLAWKGYTVFNIDKTFSGDKEKFLREIHEKLKNCVIESEGVSEEKGGGMRYSARVRNMGHGVPDFSNAALDTKTFPEAIKRYDGISLYQVRRNVDGKKVRLTFVKWVLGELKYSIRDVEYFFGEEDWCGVVRDFKSQEEHILRARSAKVK